MFFAIVIRPSPDVFYRGTLTKRAINGQNKAREKRMEEIMDNTAIALVAGGAVFFAFYFVYTKKVVKAKEWKERSSLLVALHQGGASLILFTIAFTTYGPEIQPGFLRPMLWTGILNIGILLAKMRARTLEDVSLVTPIDSTTPAIVIVTSMIINGEYPSQLGWVGIWLLVIGTYTLNIQDMKEELLNNKKKAKLAEQIGAKGPGGLQQALRVYFAPFLFIRRSRGVQLAFVAVLLSSASLTFDAQVARTANIGFGFGCVFGIAALGNLVIAIWRKEYQGVVQIKEVLVDKTLPPSILYAQIRGVLSKTLPLALFYAVGNYATNHAYLLDITPYVGTMKRLQIPLTIVLAYYLVGEKKSFRERFVGGLIMAIGAVLIKLGG